MHNKILLLGASIYQKSVITELQNMGLYVIAIDKNPKAIGRNFSNEFEVIDIVDKNKIAKLAREKKVDAIMPINDFGVRSAAFASKKLGLVGLDIESAELSNNKILMRQKWLESELRQPKFFAVNNISDFKKNISKFNYPFIIKPADCGGGSRGVIKINSEEEIEWAFENSKKYTLFSEQLIVEEFIDGIEITVECIVNNNQISILAISDKEHLKSSNYCVALSLNYMADLTLKVIEEVKKLAVSAIKSLGIKNAPVHIEMMIKNNLPFLIELSARGGGGPIFSSIVKWVSGVNYVQQYANILLQKNVDIIPKYHKGAVFRFFSCEPCKIKEIKGIKKARDIKEVVDLQIFKQAGDSIHEIKSDNERIGYVVINGEDRSHAIEKANLVESIISIVKIQNI